MFLLESILNKVLEGDCLELMAALPDQCIDMVLSDLPYGKTHNEWDKPLELAHVWLHYKRILKPNGIIALTSDGAFTGLLIVSNLPMFKYKIVWIKSKATNFLNSRKQPLRKHEDICIFYHGTPVYHPQKTYGKPYDKGVRKTISQNYNTYKPSPIINQDGKRFPVDVLLLDDETHTPDSIFIKNHDMSDRIYHATQKPVSLGRYLIRTYSNPGNIILDNACGSGSFLEAAVLEQRYCIGMEKYRYQHKKAGQKIDVITIATNRIKEGLTKRNSSLPFNEE